MTDNSSAGNHPKIVIALDREKKEFPEGVALDTAENLYFSVAPLGQVRRINPDGSQSIRAAFAIAPACTGVLGLTSDAAGNIYAAVFSGLPESNGVWQIQPDKTKERLPGSEHIFFPNAAVFDENDNLYITESTGPPIGSSFELGAVWKFPHDGKLAEPWLRHQYLTGTNSPLVPAPVPVGANGIAYHEHHLFVANTEKKQVLRIPIQEDGTAGDPTIVAKFQGKFDFLDGIACDEAGALYIVFPGRNEVAKIEHENSLTILASAADGIDFPASLAFGREGNLYVTNFATGPFPGAGPSVIRIGVP